MLNEVLRTGVARLVTMVVMAAGLGACGGGGGGSSGGGGGGSGGFTLSKSSITFSAKRGGPPPPPQTVAVHLSDTSAASLAAGYRAGVAAAPWLAASGTGSGFDYTFTLLATDTTLAAGTYTTTLTIASRDSSGHDLQGKDIAVTYTLRDGVLITSAPATITGIAGSPLPPRTVSLTVTTPSGETWTASSNAAWVVPPSGPQQGSMTLNLTVDPSALPGGTSTAIVTLTNTADPTDTATTAITADLTAPIISVDAGSVVLGGVSGQERGPAAVNVTINTGTNGYLLSLVPSTLNGGSWLSASTSPASVSGAGSTTITINADRSALAPGAYTGQLLVQATVNGQVISTPIAVTCNLDTNRLIVAATGIAFSSFPSRSVLTRSIAVGNVLDLPGATWQASTTQSWLSVTPSGTIAQSLVINANPAGLAPGQYLGQVLVTSPSSGVNNVEAIRVGLVVDTSDPPALIQIPNATAAFIATSPVEPWAVVSRGASVDVYDMYSGALLRTIATPALAQGQLLMNGDGTRLYVVDSTPTAVKIYEMVTATGAQSRTFISSMGNGSRFTYTRPGGMALVMNGLGGEAFDLFSGNTIAAAGVGGGQVVVASPDSKYLYISDGPFSSSRTYSYRLRYAQNGSQLTAVQVANNSGNEANYGRANVQDMAVSPAGDQLYVAAGAPYQFDVLDAPSLTLHPPALTGAPYPVSIETSWNGLVVGGAMTANPDIWVYNTSGTFLGNLASSLNGSNSLASASLNISGDGTRLISGGQIVRIFALPSP